MNTIGQVLVGEVSQVSLVVKVWKTAVGKESIRVASGHNMFMDVSMVIVSGT